MALEIKQVGADQGRQRIDETIRLLHAYPAIAVRLIIKHFLQEIFSHHEPGKWHWEPDEKQTEILIIDYSGTSEIQQVKPILAVQRAPISTSGLPPMAKVRSDKHFTTQLMAQVIQIPMVIHCVSRESLECESLACEVFQALLAFQSEITAMGIKGIRGLTLGVPAAAEGFFTGTKIEAFTCPVSFAALMDTYWLKSRLDAKDVQEIIKKWRISPESINVPPNTFSDVNIWKI